MRSNQRDDRRNNVLCCFSMSSSKKRKRRKGSQQREGVVLCEGVNKHAFTTTTTVKRNNNNNTTTRNATQLLGLLPKEDLVHKFNSVSDLNELIVTKQSDNSNTLRTMKYNSGNDSCGVYVKECQQTLSSLMDNDGNELASSQVMISNTNTNVSSIVKDNRLDISSYVISTNKMPSQQQQQQQQHKQCPSFHKSLFSNMSSSSSSFKQVQFESTAETSNQSIEGRKTMHEYHKGRLSSCDSIIRNGQRDKRLAYQIVKKIKEINGIKDKINEVANMVMQYEEETHKIIRTIEKEENDAQILIYMLNYLLNKQH